MLSIGVQAKGRARGEQPLNYENYVRETLQNNTVGVISKTRK